AVHAERAQWQSHGPPTRAPSGAADRRRTGAGATEPVIYPVGGRRPAAAGAPSPGGGTSAAASPPAPSSGAASARRGSLAGGAVRMTWHGAFAMTYFVTSP